MRASFCYWSVATGPYGSMMESTVQSARAVGVKENFHVWSDRSLFGTIAHPVGQLETNLYLFKFRFLAEKVRMLNYDYFIWLDADTWFVRHPGDVLRVLQHSPVHAALESDACSVNPKRRDWWGCPLPKFVDLARECGVRSHSIFNLNAGFWIVHHHAVETLCRLAFKFWNFSANQGHMFTEEAPLAYAVQMLCGNPYAHTLRGSADLWASDWTGSFRNRIPDGQPWDFEDYFTGERFRVNPAIVHAMRSKRPLTRLQEPNARILQGRIVRRLASGDFRDRRPAI